MLVLSRFTKGRGVQSGLYTKGGQFSDPGKIIANEYTGPYHLIHGRPFKGEKPSKSSEGRRLVPLTRNANKFVYSKIKESYAKEFSGIVATGPTIEQKDEDKGWFFRYVAKYLPNGEVFDIDKIQHEEIQKQKTPHHKLYSTAYLKWKIRGILFDIYTKDVITEYGIIDTNRRSIAIVEDTVPGLQKYFTDLLQYAQPSAEEKKYTDGIDFMDADEVPYIGYYHVHPLYGPMEGKYNDNMPHGLIHPIPYFNRPKSINERMIQTPQNAYNEALGKNAF